MKGTGALLFLTVVSISFTLSSCGYGSINSEEEARKASIGTWTYTESNAENVWWKLVIKSDGTFEKYLALPSDDNWGTPETGTWEITTGKFPDTGHRYYAVHLQHSIECVLYNSNMMTLGHGDAFLTKGDQFPFSK
ncbi:MAG: hypothetical protein ABSF91_07580 [Bacteroidota bacterium]|jgi:hypothetical protein